MYVDGIEWYSGKYNALSKLARMIFHNFPTEPADLERLVTDS